jgi:methyl-accepting chemotaxis protein
MRQLYRVSLKWKIFIGCVGLSAAILLMNWQYVQYVAHQSASRTGTQMKSVYRRYETYQKSIAAGMSAAVDLWSSSPRLVDALAKGDDDATHALFTDGESILHKSIRPDFVMLVDKHGDVIRSKDAAIEPSDVSAMRLFADLKQGMSIDNTILEHHRRGWLVVGEPVKRGNDVVGAVVIGKDLVKLFAEFKAQSDDDPKKQVELAMIHNQEVTAASAHVDDWDDIARASRREAWDTDTDKNTPLLLLPDGKHEFFAAQVNGYEGGSMGSIGQIFVMRNRFDREQALRSLLHDAFILVLGAMLVAGIVSFAMGMTLTKPLHQFITATREIAHGEGDLTRRIDVTRVGGATETRELAENLNAMFGNLHRLASEVQGASLQVGASSAEISAASKQMLSGASDQAQKIESSTAAVTELSSSIQQVAENAVQATKVAQESGDNLRLGMAKLTETNDLIGETAQKIQALGQSGRRIGNIVEVIRQISEQTSLLALNASIEAAHAGEQGRGFAVVADEVSSLARRVGQSAKDIEGLIATISEQTAESVTSMQNVTRTFGEHLAGTARMQGALKQIIDVVGDTARSVQEQAVVSDEIARNMDAVQKIAQEVLGSSKEAVVQGEQLHALALRLEQLVRGFRIDDSAESPPRLMTPSVTAALPEKAQSSGERRKVARS